MNTEETIARRKILVGCIALAYKLADKTPPKMDDLAFRASIMENDLGFIPTDWLQRAFHAARAKYSSIPQSTNVAHAWNTEVKEKRLFEMKKTEPKRSIEPPKELGFWQRVCAYRISKQEIGFGAPGTNQEIIDAASADPSRQEVDAFLQFLGNLRTISHAIVSYWAENNPYGLTMDNILANINSERYARDFYC